MSSALAPLQIAETEIVSRLKFGKNCTFNFFKAMTPERIIDYSGTYDEYLRSQGLDEKTRAA